MKYLSTILVLCLSVFTASAAVPTFNDFNGNQFLSNNFKVYVKSGAVMTNTSHYKGAGAATITLVEEAGDSASLRIGSFDVSADGQVLTFTELGGPSTIFSYNVATDTFHVDEKVLISEQLNVATGQDGEAIYQYGGGTNYFDASTRFSSNVFVKSLTASNAVASRVAMFDAANTLTNVNISSTAIVRANGSAVTIGSGLSDNGTTLSATGGGSGDTNAISYVGSNPEWINAARVRIGASSAPVFDVARFTNGNSAIVVSNNAGGASGQESVVIKSASGVNIFQHIRDGSTEIDSEGNETIIESGGVPFLYGSDTERRISDVAGVQAANFADRDNVVIGDFTFKLGDWVDGGFLSVDGSDIVTSTSLTLSELDVTTAYLTNVVFTNISAGVLGTDSNGKVVTKYDLTGMTNFNGQKLYWPTNAASDVSVTLNNGYSAIATNNNIAYASLTGVSTALTNVQWATVIITNTSGSLKTATFPASWMGDSPLYITNQSVFTVMVYPNLGTNVVGRPLK